MGKWSDGEQYDIEREGAREELDEVEDMILVVCWEVYVLSNVEWRENSKKLGGEVVGGVIHVYDEVADDEEFMRCGCRSGEKRCEFIQKGNEY